MISGVQGVLLKTLLNEPRREVQGPPKCLVKGLLSLRAPKAARRAAIRFSVVPVRSSEMV